MAIDFSKCEIRTPESPLELKRLYQMLAEVFPVEKDFFEGLIDGSRTLYNWRPYTLYHGDEPLGNVSVVMFQLKSGTGLQETAGIASVATPERHRGMGIARQLMEHVLKKIDGRNLPSVLFTSMPRVYSGLGYQVVDQGVMQVSVKPMVQADGLTPSYALHALTAETLQQLKSYIPGCCRMMANCSAIKNAGTTTHLP